MCAMLKTPCPCTMPGSLVVTILYDPYIILLYGVLSLAHRLQSIQYSLNLSISDVAELVCGLVWNLSLASTLQLGDTSRSERLGLDQWLR